MEFWKTVQRTEIYQGPIFKVVPGPGRTARRKGQAQRDLIFIMEPEWLWLLLLLKIRWSSLSTVPQRLLEATSYKLAGQLEVGENADHMQLHTWVEEETGYTGQLELVYDFYSAIGFCNEKELSYIKASQLTKVENPRPPGQKMKLCNFEVSLGGISCCETVTSAKEWLFNIGKCRNQR